MSSHPRPLTILAAICLCAVVVAPSNAAPRAKAKSPARPSAAGKPNVLFIIADDLRDYPAWLGGHPQAKTPNMDRLAAKGMRFTNAHCNYALCNPSRTSIMTGMLPSSNGVFGNEQDWRRSIQIVGKPTLPAWFRTQGFATAAGGKIFHANHGGPDGRLTGWHGGRRGFDDDSAWEQRFPEAGVQIPDLPVRTGQNFNGLNIWHWDWGMIDFPDELTDDGAVTAWASQVLKQRAKQPFFLAVGLYRPHSPWYVPQKYFDLYPLDQVKPPEVREDDLNDVPEFARKVGEHHEMIVKAGKWQEAVRAYLANVSFCDAMLGRVLAALERGPNARDTVVVFTSDHGWYLGEKQMWHKGRLWEEATRVPLSISAPGVTAPNTVSDQPVSLVDLYPTLCDLAEIAKPPHLDGQSLVPLLQNPALRTGRPAITAMGGGASVSYAARDERWRYIRYADGSEELYDHAGDPHEWTNQASDPGLAEVKERLAASFPAEFKSASRPAAMILGQASPDGSTYLDLQPGDLLSADESPNIKGRGVHFDVTLNYRPDVDRDSTIIAQGGSRLGYALHLMNGVPTLTLFEDGKASSIGADAIKPGLNRIRASIDALGLMSLAVPGESEILGPSPFDGGFPDQPAQGLTVGASFGVLSPKDYPNSTPFDGEITRLRMTISPPAEQIARPEPAGSKR